MYVLKKKKFNVTNQTIFYIKFMWPYSKTNFIGYWLLLWLLVMVMVMVMVMMNK